jgi:hypothetical protein
MKTWIKQVYECGHCSTSKTDKNVEKFCQAVLAGCHFTIDKISEITGYSWISYQHILTEDLMLKWVSAKFVLHLLA